MGRSHTQLCTGSLRRIDRADAEARRPEPDRRAGRGCACARAGCGCSSPGTRTCSCAGARSGARARSGTRARAGRRARSGTCTATRLRVFQELRRCTGGRRSSRARGRSWLRRAPRPGRRRSRLRVIASLCLDAPAGKAHHSIRDPSSRMPREHIRRTRDAESRELAGKHSAERGTSAQEANSRDGDSRVRLCGFAPHPHGRCAASRRIGTGGRGPRLNQRTDSTSEPAQPAWIASRPPRSRSRPRRGSSTRGSRPSAGPRGGSDGSRAL